MNINDYSKLFDKTAFQQARINKGSELALKLFHRRGAIGAGVGAVAGGIAGGAATHATMDKKNKDRKAHIVLNAARGSLAGGALGYSVGQLTAMKRLNRYAKRESDYVRYANSARRKKQYANSGGGGGGGGGRSWGGAGGRSSSRGQGESHSFWDKVPESVRHKARSVATHAKKTPGPEGENARSILKNMAKKHGFDPDMAVKEAAFKIGFMKAASRQ